MKHWERLYQPEPLHILITGAAGQIGYNLCFLISRGFLFDNEIILHLYDINENALKGLEMELTDCNFPKLKGIVYGTEIEKVFKDVEIAIIVAGIPRKQGMQRSDLIQVNKKIMEINGKALGMYAHKDCRVLVVANPANTNALVIKNTSKLPAHHISALTRLDQNRAVQFVANEMKTKSEFVHNVIIWGNHSNTMVPDLTFAYAANENGIQPLSSVVEDIDLFNENVRKRGEEVINARKASSAGSAANAICQHLKDWLLGTENGIMTSMAVWSNGEYDISKGIYFSMPVTCSFGEYQVVEHLKLNNNVKEQIVLSEIELLDERKVIE